METKIPRSCTFEKFVLSQTFKNDPYFQKINPDLKHVGNFQGFTDPAPHLKRNEEERKDDEGWCWWRPGKSIFSQYFQYSSMHGLKYISQKQRHLSERIFWFLSFLVSILVAVYLTNKVWVRYNENPVIVSFGSDKLSIEEIPFPTVTICNIDKISKDVINRLVVRAEKEGSGSLATLARRNLGYVRTMCNNHKSFAQRNGFASNRGRLSFPDYPSSGNSSDDGSLIFLAEWMTPCDELIRACMWKGQRRNCSDLFKSTFTGLGKCCTFNRLPRKLLYTDVMRKWYYENIGPKIPRKERIRPSETKNWQAWNYTFGFTKPRDAKRPRFQPRPGSPFGLSILVDPRVHRYFCPTSDSLGFRLRLHTPVDASEASKYSVGFGLNQEVYLEVEPTITLADTHLLSFPFDRRKCLFPKERQLKFYNAYTQTNCFMECKSEIMRVNCSCATDNFLKDAATPICSSNPRSKQYRCARLVTKKIDSQLRSFCSSCVKACSSLTYRIKATSSELQNSSDLWFDHSEKLLRPPDWAGHQMTTLHIYFGKVGVVPRIRREMYGTLDLIANTGNLVTLCLGFSILSAVEIIYFLTIRVCWNGMRKIFESSLVSLKRVKNPFDQGKILVQPQKIQVQPSSGSIEHKLQKVSLYDAPSNFYMINELYNPSLYLEAPPIKKY